MVIPFKVKLDVAAWLDRKEAQIRRVGERIGWPQKWLQEFIEYRGDPRMTLEEFYVLYTLKRMEAQPRITGELSEAQALAFYRESDYMLWRNLVHRRHSAWRRVLWTMPKKRGNLWEIGCAIAPISTYCASRKPEWDYWLHDLESAHLGFGIWRVKQRAHLGVINTDPDEADVITLIDVLEHLSDPFKMACKAARILRSGGYLHWNFVGNPRRNDLDLATPEQRDETVKYLYDNLRLVWEGAGYRISRKA